MGLESANFTLVPDDGTDRMREVLAAFNASQVTPVASSNFDRWSVKGERYWIDLMVGAFGPNSKPSISVRIALTNPEEALGILRTLLTALLEGIPGRLHDNQTGRSYKSLSEETWGDIHAGVVAKRAEFQKQFGPFEAAVSGDDVFTILSSRKEV